MDIHTELTTFLIKAGFEERANEWMKMLNDRHTECVRTLDREQMHFESIFKCERNGRLLLTWFSVQSTTGAHVNSSQFEVDQLHIKFWKECVDQSSPPEDHIHLINFVPHDVLSSIRARADSLAQDGCSNNTQ